MGKRKTPYVPGIAQINFKPDFDWEIDIAHSLFSNAHHVIHPVDTIFFEDCISGMQHLPADSIDLIIADPPFGIQFNGKGSQYNRDENLVVENYAEVFENYDQFSEKWITELPRLMKETASAYIFSGWSNLKDILNALDKHKLTLINHIIWKYQFGVFTKSKFVTSHYHILFVVKNPKKYFFNKIEHYPLDIWDIPRKYSPGQQKNGTKLPEEVVMRAINFSSKPGDLVLDPFIGNGTTAVSAKLLYRHFLGFEQNTNMKPILEQNLNTIEVGAGYQPYHTFIPSITDLAKKYPAIRNQLKDQNQKN